MKARTATWKVLASAAAVAALLVTAGVFVFGDALNKGVQTVRERGDRTKSEENVAALVIAHHGLAQREGRPPVGGKAFVLWVAADGRINPEAPGALEVFFSPADRGALSRARLSEFRALTRERLRQGADVRHMTSYVGPRLEAEGRAPSMLEEPRPLIADLHFAGGAIVGYTNGRVVWMTRDELGLAPGDPLVAGPTSVSPILRRLSE